MARRTGHMTGPAASHHAPTSEKEPTTLSSAEKSKEPTTLFVVTAHVNTAENCQLLRATLS